MEVNKIYHDDWMNNQLPDKSVQLIIADPPYYKVKGDFDFVMKTTTTTTNGELDVIIKEEKQIDLQSFLDTKRLTRAEKMFYNKTYGTMHQNKSPKEWSQLTKLV